MEAQGPLMRLVALALEVSRWIQYRMAALDGIVSRTYDQHPTTKTSSRISAFSFDDDGRSAPTIISAPKNFVLDHIKAVLSQAKDMADQTNEVVIITEYDIIDVEQHLYHRGFFFGPSSFWRQQIASEEETLENLTHLFFLAVRPLRGRSGDGEFEIVKEFSSGLLAQEGPARLTRARRPPPTQAVFHELDSRNLAWSDVRPV